MILPGVAYDHELLVHSIDATGAAEPLQIFVLSSTRGSVRSCLG